MHRMPPSARELLLHILDETADLLSVSDQLNQAEFVSMRSLARTSSSSIWASLMARLGTSAM